MGSRESHHSDQKYQALFENSITALFITKPDGSILEANEAACKMFGYTNEEICELGREGIISTDTPRLEEMLIERRQKGSVQGELIGVRKNGDQIWCDFSSSLFKDEDGEILSSVMMVETTNHRRTKLEVELLIDNTEESFILMDQDLKIRSFNAQFESLYHIYFGVRIQKGDSILDYARPDRRETVKGIYERVLNGETEHSILTALHPDGSEKLISITYKPARDDDEEIIGAFVTAVDVTEEINARKELEQSIERYHYVTQATSDAIWEYVPSTDVLFWGEGFKTLFGHEYLGEKKGLSRWMDNIHPDDRTIIEQHIPELLKGTDSRWDQEYRFRKADGEYAFIRDKAIVVRDELGRTERVIGAMEDITERKSAESQILSKTRQLDAIAEFNSRLIKEDTWQQALQSSLELFGRVVSADRVYYFENDYTANEAGPVTNMRMEWTTGTVTSELENPLHHELLLDEIRVFIDELIDRKPYNRIVRQIEDKSFREFLEAQQVKSLLALPVYTGNHFRGFVGFDDCSNERSWSEEEVSFLQTISLNLATAIENEDAELALQSAFDEKNEILERIGDGFFAVDKSFTVTYWNNQAEKLLYTEKERILGEQLWDHFDKSIAAESYRNYKRAMAEQVPQHFEDYYEPIGRWFDVNVYPSENGLSVFFKDITEEKSAEEQLKQKSRLIEAIADVNRTLLAYDDWYMAIDEAFSIIGEAVVADRVYYFENRTDPKTGELVTSQKLEWTRDKIEPEIDNPELQEVPISLFDEFLGHLAENRIYSGLVKNVSDINVKGILERQKIRSIAAIPIFVQEAFWGFIGIDDCSRERIWQDEVLFFLQTVGNNLATAIAKREADLAFMDLFNELEIRSKELAASNAELEQFAFVASHDLQEPLRMITSFLAQLEKKYDAVLDEKGKKYIYFAIDGAKRMRQIILDLLEFSRVGRVETERELVDMNELVREALSLNRKLIEESGAIIILDELPVITAARSSLGQLFQNLINNAVKYQKSGNRPEIQITCQESEDEWQFSVRDNGIGIKPEYREKIFNIFQRLHRTEEYSGSGMGLAICKKIVEDHQGKIHVESAVGEGSTFRFTISKPG